MFKEAWERVAVLSLAMICLTVVTVAYSPIGGRFPVFLGQRPAVKVSAGCPVSTPNVPDGPDPWGGCFPGTVTTGVPAGTVLSTYSGPCTITTNNTTIDAKDMTACEPVEIQAANVTITRSSLVQIYLNTDSPSAGGWSFTITDSDIDRGQVLATAETNRGISGQNFTVSRVDVQGGYSNGFCWTNCVVRDTYFHHQWQVQPGEGPGNVHASAFRQQDNLTLTHNTIFCEVTFVEPDNGCSADVSGYPDFGPIHHLDYRYNMFMANIWAGFCVYGGATGSKPYSSDPLNAKNIRFNNNVFQKGVSETCGAFGPSTDFDAAESTNEWNNNFYDDGSAVPHG